MIVGVGSLPIQSAMTDILCSPAESQARIMQHLLILRDAHLLNAGINKGEKRAKYIYFAL